MSSPLPHRPSINYTPQSELALDIATEDSSAVLQVLSSETARSVLRSLSTSPSTASDLSRDNDVSLQTVNYHLKNLCEAGLITEVGTWYSSKGAEMSVYAPSSTRVEITLTPESGATPSDSV